jgi:hypothetical protein
VPGQLQHFNSPHIAFADIAMAQQYGGYNQVGYGSNPYDQRDNDGQDPRFNNYSQGRYDDRTCTLPSVCFAAFLLP